MNWLKEILSELTYEGKPVTPYKLAQISEIPLTTLKRILEKNSPLEKAFVGTLHKIVLGICKIDHTRDYTLTLLTIIDKYIK